jgi:hypothetical protein
MPKALTIARVLESLPVAINNFFVWMVKSFASNRTSSLKPSEGLFSTLSRFAPSCIVTPAFRADSRKHSAIVDDESVRNMRRSASVFNFTPRTQTIDGVG